MHRRAALVLAVLMDVPILVPLFLFVEADGWIAAEGFGEARRRGGDLGAVCATVARLECEGGGDDELNGNNCNGTRSDEEIASWMMIRQNHTKVAVTKQKKK